MDLFARIDAARERWNVLSHPFYRRWSEGRLEQDELAFYAGEYRNAVVALAQQSRAAAECADAGAAAELAEHAREEEAHVAVWDGFGRAVNSDPGRAPLDRTTACSAAWTAGESLLDRLVVLYAVESAQPAISRTKLEGLRDHYGFGPDAEGAAYFELHAERDHEHAEQARRLIAERLGAADEDRLAALAEHALEGNWRLLDGVEARAAA